MMPPVGVALAYAHQPHPVTQQVYDPLGEAVSTSITPPGLGAPTAEQTAYDANGNATTYTDFGGVQHATAYDAANRPKEVTDGPAGSGQLDTTVGADADGETTGYNTSGQTDYAGSPFSTNYVASWNGADWLTQESTPELTAGYEYDAAGFARSQTLTPVNGSVPSVTESLSPDAADRVQRLSDGTNATGFAYWPDDQLQQVTVPLRKASPPSQAQESLAYDPEGVLQTVSITGLQASLLGITAPWTWSEQYATDAMGWTSAYTLTDSSLVCFNQETTLSHDAAGRLVGSSSPIDGRCPQTAYAWAYDASGNLTADRSWSGVMAQTTDAYSDTMHPSRLQSISDHDGNPIASFAYTPAGGLAQETGLGSYASQGWSRTLTYDAANRVHQIALAGQTVTMGYDAQGERSRYQVQDAHGQLVLDERFGYSNGQLSLVQVRTNDGQHCKGGDASCAELILYRPDGAPLELLYYAPNSATPARYWYVVDGRGDVVALCNEAGVQLQAYRYDGWGRPLDNQSATFYQQAVPQPLGYRGYVYDVETQSYWLGVRQYDPLLRRFLQPDPSEQDGVQSYVYCGDNPVDCSDPSGLGEGPDEVEGGFGAAGMPGDVLVTVSGGAAAVADAAQAETAGVDSAAAQSDIAATSGEMASEDPGANLYNRGEPLTKRQKTKLRYRASLSWERITGVRPTTEGMEIHHESPLEHSHLFEEQPNRLGNLISVENDPGGVHDQIDQEWSDFRATYKALGRSPTAEEVTQKLEDIQARFGDYGVRLSDLQPQGGSE